MASIEFLPCDGEEYACRSDPGVAELPSDCGFNSHNRKAVPLSSIDRMAARAPGEAIQGADLDVVAEFLLLSRKCSTINRVLMTSGEQGHQEWGQQLS